MRDDLSSWTYSKAIEDKNWLEIMITPEWLKALARILPWPIGDILGFAWALAMFSIMLIALGGALRALGFLPTDLEPQ